ncbi:M23 family metallopeptidase [Bacteroides sp.]|uniref:M23 family metallopeptidase n=1 Tax=Bacteroides sp. TaxID=29523 RepID=UPI001B48BE78|nr:M23 family metallopeptidase [Bacteroides sp.]MBP6064433.1 M23 family metallopeptidase [Bacteroides sp.]MBP6067230.1 M23 family metallopeptidase [Bacteroides sp.]MBP6936233.1 M23 family metallopeptidase [Bacteroides sp.]MBP8621180.1 M23 family metallopeptidase [Bacteroides sp.]MBP9506515.1 M23 family metallopeptidase [Bacteroides sp.]
MKPYIAALLLACTFQGHAQENSQVSFVPPFDFPLVLSGNFGELRSNHFHGGIDFKTNNVIRKPVLALADGYISRIRVTQGSGYVLDVVYNNGYTTINRHLDGFLLPLSTRIETLQYEQESYEVEIVPAPDEYPVKAGQQIAWSGNTGYSYGPHLHLDVFETATGDYIDPLPFFAHRMKDTTAPRAESIMLFPQTGKGVVEGRTTNRTIQPNGAQPIEAWGVLGVGLKAYDYMNGVSNHYGVHTVILSLDDKEVFRSTVDRYSPEETRMINSWTHGAYMKSFIDPGNTLRMLKASNDNRGLIDINEERDYRFSYQLSDAFGNTSRYRFTVRGRKQQIPVVQQRAKYLFHWDKTNYLQEPGLTLAVPRGMLYDDVALNYSVRADSGAIAFTYQLHAERVPLHGSCELSIGLRSKPVADVTKYYVAQVNSKGGKWSVGGAYENGFMKARIRELGTYTIAVDTIPPVVTPVGKANWGRSGKIIYRMKDAETGIRSYRGTIDGKYALFALPNMVRKQWICELDPKRVKKGGRHTVEMTVTDDCGNVTVTRDTFIW